MREGAEVHVGESQLRREGRRRSPAVAERQAGVDGPWLTVRLPGSTRIRLILTLTLRARPPSYATPFDSDRP